MKSPLPGMVEAMEGAGFEIHDVEGWHKHYALTLSANETEAIRLVGEERYRVWMAYLVGLSFGFTDGTLRLFQVLGSKHEAKGPSAMPATRADLYERPMPSRERSLAARHRAWSQAVNS